MGRILPLIVSVAIFTVACSKLEEKPTIDTYAYMTKEEKEAVNKITFEVQKVLDIIDDFRKKKSLAYVVDLDVPGWKVYHKSENLLVFKKRKFVAEKEFSVPPGCVKTVNGATLNVCHVKLEQNLKRLGEAFDCEAKVEEVASLKPTERVKLVCPY